MLDCGSDPVTGPMREDITRIGFEALPTGEEWRIGMMNELIDTRDGDTYINSWTTKEIEEMLVFL